MPPAAIPASSGSSTRRSQGADDQYGAEGLHQHARPASTVANEAVMTVWATAEQGVGRPDYEGTGMAAAEDRRCLAPPDASIPAMPSRPTTSGPRLHGAPGRRQCRHLAEGSFCCQPFSADRALHFQRTAAYCARLPALSKPTTRCGDGRGLRPSVTDGEWPPVVSPGSEKEPPGGFFAARDPGIPAFRSGRRRVFSVLQRRICRCPPRYFERIQPARAPLPRGEQEMLNVKVSAARHAPLIDFMY